MRSGFALVVWLTACLLVLERPALAQSEYEAALDRALSAHASGQLDEARSFMERAHALEPSARTWRGLGIIAFAQERFVEAVAPLEQALASEVRPLTPELRAAVDELLTRIWSRIARLRLQLEPADSKVVVDGLAPVWHAQGELLLVPGAHHVQVSATEHAQYSLDLYSAAGTIQSLRLHLPAKPSARAAASAKGRELGPSKAPAGSPLSPVSAAESERRPRWWTTRTRNVALTAAGGVVATGLALWLAAYRKFRAIDDDCRALPAGGCSASEARKRFERAHIQPYSRAGIAVGALGGAALLSALSLELWPRRGVSVDVVLSPSSLRLHSRF
jgi:hypothetical protein